MTDHVMHNCTVFGKAEVFKTRLGWPHDELPLNKLRHEKCPYCGKKTEDMKPATGQDVAILSSDPQSNSFMKGRGGFGRGNGSDNNSSQILDELKRLRAEISEIRNPQTPTEGSEVKDETDKTDTGDKTDKTTEKEKENDK